LPAGSSREERSIVWGILVLHTTTHNGKKKNNSKTKKARLLLPLRPFPKEIVRPKKKKKEKPAIRAGGASEPALSIPFSLFSFRFPTYSQKSEP
jgi:hypothetical protein